MRPREKIAVVGASGYAGEELLERLLTHPGAEIVCLTSRQHAGRLLHEVYPRFRRRRTDGVAYDDLCLSAPDADAIIRSGAKFAILALPHGLASEFAVPLLAGGLRVVDLSADFRLRSAEVYREFYEHEHPAPQLLAEAVYGLPEIPGRREAIAGARLVAAPGCYPTSILVPLVPLLRAGLIDPAQILVSSMSGVSGAGRKADVDLLFAECNENAKPYGVPGHRHLSEIEQELSLAAGGGVGVAAVEHHGADVPRAQVRGADLHGRGLDPVGREHRRRDRGHLGADQRQIRTLVVLALDPAARRAGEKPRRGGDAARNHLEGVVWRHQAGTWRWENGRPSGRRRPGT